VTEKADIEYLLRQLSMAEHRVDREGVRALAARYGLEFPLFDYSSGPPSYEGQFFEEDPAPRDWKAAQELYKELERANPNTGAHGTHCWMNEYPDGCKYGDSDCPATPKVWPHKTFDEDGRIVYVTQNLDIIPA
jgi:hypothetical protein